jgi:hypothetical protein
MKPRLLAAILWFGSACYAWNLYAAFAGIDPGWGYGIALSVLAVVAVFAAGRLRGQRVAATEARVTFSATQASRPALTMEP